MGGVVDEIIVSGMRNLDMHFRAISADAIEFLHYVEENCRLSAHVFQRVIEEDELGNRRLPGPWCLFKIPYDIRRTCRRNVDINVIRKLVASASHIKFHARSCSHPCSATTAHIIAQACELHATMKLLSVAPSVATTRRIFRLFAFVECPVTVVALGRLRKQRAGGGQRNAASQDYGPFPDGIDVTSSFEILHAYPVVGTWLVSSSLASAGQRLSLRRSTFDNVITVQFGVTTSDGTHENFLGRGEPELIQNFNGTPFFGVES